ncbi:MAG: DUF721 domain-containing protein [Gemmatimonadota bacterium]
MSDRDGPVRVGDLLDRVLERKGVRSQVRRMAVLEDWAERVGTGIARVTRPRKLAEGTLFVEVRSSAWLMELNMMKGEILARLNEGREEGDGVDRIVFVLAETE